ncbi:SusC/RagA family TonB-linked outer membrane protein [Cloacibacterium sp. TD35]|uniref:SusC/RagA family TonB-linked outer membrane protein n=1 Tax=Cloacibacterium sp. TD35 TaxID=2976818 RepID=UPI00237E4A4A|nr:SusC/RagA family TonB-linked outer membrane protein [Cloacibacterium sp. TD35]WDT67316.1 SusC/RagA family TonB-linked outer membrane protein [Cloacibacterium sp. TD35]
MRNYSKVLKIAPAFLLAGTIMLEAQQRDSIKQRDIEQVVLIGYGKQKKTDLTGSIASVTAKDFNGGATSPAQLIQGKTPGVQVTTNSGAPGAGASIRVRGTASLNGNPAPLIVIDGVPQDFSGISGAADPLSLINPNDIESFDILKDAASTAIYGNRATNGVILITTKKGSAGKFKVNFSTMTSVSTKMGNVDVLDANQYREFVNAYANDNYKSKLGIANTNWQNLIYQVAWGTDNNLVFSGGVKGLPYRLSLGYNHQNGIVKTNEFKRTSLGLNLNPKFFDNHLTVNVNLKGTYTDNRFLPDGVISSATYFDPTQPVYSGNSNYGGYYEWLLNGGLNVNANANPLAMLDANRKLSSVYRALGNIQLDYKFHFLPDLHFNVNAGYDYAKGEGVNTTYGQYKGGYADNGRYNEYSQEKKNKLLETYLNYTKKVSVVNMDLTAGYSYQDFYNEEPSFFSYTGKNTPPVPSTPKANQTTLLSFYGRAIFTIANKYIINASMRRDGSSRFFNKTKDYVWGNFPGVSVAWRLDQESFLKGTGVNTLKLRGGWGQTGQQELPISYGAFAKYSESQIGAEYQFGGNFYTMYRPDVYNPYLTWETTTTKNLGLDFGFANNRISGSVDVFRKDTKDLLVFSPIPAGDLSNFNWLNVGTIKNEGIEGVINLVPVKNENTTWELGFNATHYKPIVNKLINNATNDYFIATGGISGGVGNTIQAHAVGYNPSSFLVYQQVYDVNGKPLDGVYVDRNGDGMISAQDKYYYKSTTPDAILGFSTKLTHKNWDFSMSGRAVLGNYVYNNAASNSSINSALTNEYLQNVYSTAKTYAFKGNELFSDIFVEDASFFRLDNVNLGYVFKDFISSGNSLKVYGMVQNVFVISDYSGIDPEVFGGIDNGYYQMPRVYSLGFNFQF